MTRGPPVLQNWATRKERELKTSTRLARSTAGALQRKLPPTHFALLATLAALVLIAFPLLGAATGAAVQPGDGLLQVQAVLFGLMTFTVAVTLAVLYAFWIPAGSAYNVDAVLEYVKWATDTQRLADQAKYISYGPARHSSGPLVGEHADLGIDMKPHMPTNAENSKTTLLFNYEWWADNRAEMDERFQAWLAQ